MPNLPLSKNQEIHTNDVNEHYRALFDLAPFAVFYLGQDHRIVEANPYAERFTGYSQSELKVMSLFELQPEDEQGATDRVISCLRNGERIANQELRYQTKSGEIRNGRLSLNFVKASGGNEQSWLAVVVDITNHKVIEEELFKKNEQFVLALRGATDGLWDWDLRSNEVYFSPRWKNMLGYLDHEIKNDFSEWQALLHPEDVNKAMLAVQNYLQGVAENYAVEFRMQHKDGHYVDVLARGFATRDAAGNNLRIVGTHVDISALKRAEILQAGRRKIFEYLLSNEPLETVLSELVSGAVDYNPQIACSLLLLDEQGKHLNHTAAVGLPEFYTKAIDGVAIGQGVGSCGNAAYTGERTIVTDIQSHPFWHDYRELAEHAGVGACWSEPIKDTSGRVLGTLAVYFQIAKTPNAADLDFIKDTAHIASIAIERNRVETEQKQLQKQLQQAQKMEAVGQLTGGIAHDFNNILSTILGYAGLLKSEYAGQDNGEFPEFVEQIQLAGERAKQLVKQMLTFSRKQSTEQHALSLPTLVAESVKMMRPLLPSSIEIKTVVDDRVPAIMGDSVQLHQVLMNLCINARDAMSAIGRLRISLQQVQQLHGVCAACHQSFVNNWVELQVEDTGSGVDPQLRDRIFEPFVTSKEVGKGSGMGLAIVHGIVHEHGGHIVLDSDGKSGTSLRLLFPVAAPTVTMPEQSVDAEQRPETQSAAERHILVVDDESSVAGFLKALLTRNGYTVTVENDSKTALQLFEQAPYKYDLVITDQTMPGLTGASMAESMFIARPDIPVILCTGHSEQIDADKASAIGLKGFMHKPVDNQEILQLIASVLQ